MIETRLLQYFLAIAEQDVLPQIFVPVSIRPIIFVFIEVSGFFKSGYELFFFVPLKCRNFLSHKKNADIRSFLTF